MAATWSAMVGSGGDVAVAAAGGVAAVRGEARRRARVWPRLMAEGEANLDQRDDAELGSYLLEL